MQHARYVLAALATGGCMLVFMAGLTYYTPTSGVGQNRATPEDSRTPTLQVEETKQSTTPQALYLPKTLVAKVACVVDATTGHALFAQRADAPQPLASITKVMTALAARELLQPSDRVSIPVSVADDGADGLAEGEVWTVKNLSDFMLVTSSNRAARALRTAAVRRAAAEVSAGTGEDVFIRTMNSMAAYLGMAHTVYKNETGLDIADTYATNIGSARDVATLFAHVLATVPEMFEATEDSVAKIASSSAWHTAVSTNKALADIPGLIGGKTGFTDVAGGNLAIIFDVEPGHPIIVVVLGSSKDERFSDVLTLVQATRSAYGVATSAQVALPI